MRHLIQASLIAATMLALPAAAWAQATSPVGTWKTIDDKTGKPKALVRITEESGVLTGKIEKLYRAPSEEQNPLCGKCSDARARHYGCDGFFAGDAGRGGKPAGKAR